MSIVSSFSRLLDVYSELGVTFAKAMLESTGCGSDKIACLETNYGCLSNEAKELFLFKDGPSDSWLSKGCNIIPGYDYVRFDLAVSSYSNWMKMCRNTGMESFPDRVFPILDSFSGSLFYLPVYNCNISTSPVYFLDPECGYFGVQKYDCLESMILTILAMFESGYYCSYEGGIIEDPIGVDTYIKIGALLNPKSEYWRSL